MYHGNIDYSADHELIPLQAEEIGKSSQEISKEMTGSQI